MLKKLILITLVMIVFSTLVVFGVTFYKKKDPVYKSSKYSFFVAGHVYGKPGQLDKTGLHPAFKLAFDSIRNKSIDFGVFAGDSVIRSTPSRYSALKRDIKLLGIPIHLVLGNHEVANDIPKGTMDKNFPEKFYFWVTNNDLHIVLDSVSDGWNIEGTQLQFIRETLVANDLTRNVFIYTHNTIWWNKENYQELMLPNSFWGRNKKSNFWTEFVPILKATQKPVYLFAGDVGASLDRTFAFYQKIDKIHLIATGMGGGKDDNFLITHVDDNHQVSFESVSYTHLTLPTILLV